MHLSDQASGPCSDGSSVTLEERTFAMPRPGSSEAARKNIGTPHAFISAEMPTRRETPLTPVDDKVHTDHLDDQQVGHEEKG